MADTPKHNTSQTQHDIAQRLERDLLQAKEKSVSSFNFESETEQRTKVRLVRRYEVERRTGLSRSTIYDWMKRGEFPQPVKLGSRMVAWRENDIIAWMEARETRGA